MRKMGTGAKVAIAVAAAAALTGVVYAATRGPGTSTGGTPGGPKISITVS